MAQCVSTLIPTAGKKNYHLYAQHLAVMRILCAAKRPRYGLDGSGIEFRCELDFQHTFRPSIGPTQPPIQWIEVLLPGLKRPGRDVNHPPPSSAR